MQRESQSPAGQFRESSIAAAAHAPATIRYGKQALARPARIERATPGFGGQYSIH
jgi:hypothetical protein